MKTCKYHEIIEWLESLWGQDHFAELQVCQFTTLSFSNTSHTSCCASKLSWSDITWRGCYLNAWTYDFLINWFTISWSHDSLKLKIEITLQCAYISLWDKACISLNWDKITENLKSKADFPTRWHLSWPAIWTCRRWPWRSSFQSTRQTRWLLVY